MNRPQKFKILKLITIIFALIFGYTILVYGLALIPQEKLIGKKCLPNHLKDKLHDDYALPFIRWIPFSATSCCFVEPPIMLLGNQKHFSQAQNGQLGPKPIPQPGEWQISLAQVKKGWPLFLPYLALTTKNKYHIRIGCRWDDLDHYYVFPSLSLKKISPH